VGGTVIVVGGSYGGSFTVSDGGLQFRLVKDSQNSQTIVTLSGSVTLAAATTLTLYDDATYDPANLTLASSGTINGSRALTIATSTNDTGTVVLAGVIGGTTALTSLTIGSSGAKVVSVTVNDVRTTGAVGITQPVQSPSRVVIPRPI
jgi:hypothetical protein